MTYDSNYREPDRASRTGLGKATVVQEFKQRLLTQAEGLLVKRELRQISTTLPGAESAADRNAAIDECMRRWGQMPPAPDAAGDHDQPGAARNLNERARGHVRPGEPREDHNAG